MILLFSLVFVVVAVKYVISIPPPTLVILVQFKLNEIRNEKLAEIFFNYLKKQKKYVFDFHFISVNIYCI